jgi:hypothetical protein
VSDHERVKSGSFLSESYRYREFLKVPRSTRSKIFFGFGVKQRKSEGLTYVAFSGEGDPWECREEYYNFFYAFLRTSGALFELFQADSPFLSRDLKPRLIIGFWHARVRQPLQGSARIQNNHHLQKKSIKGCQMSTGTFTGALRRHKLRPFSFVWGIVAAGSRVFLIHNRV